MLKFKKQKLKGPVRFSKLKSDSKKSGNKSGDDSGIEEPGKMVRIRKRGPSPEAARPDVSEKKPKKLDYYRPPTAEEMKKLKETETQFHSNLFRMQYDECLRSMNKSQAKLKPLLEAWLSEFNEQFLGELQPMNKKWELSDEMTWLGAKIKVPFQPCNEVKGKFQFVPPKNKAFFIGSQSLDTTICSGNVVDIDVALEMPKEFFQTADYLNEIYHYKKSLYLCYLLKKMKKIKSLGIVKKEFSLTENNPLLPVLALGIQLGGIEVTILIHLCLEDSTYKLVRFIPSRNNLRGNYFFQLNDEETSELNICPTPHYNNSILRDLVLRKNNQLLVDTFAGHKNVSEAVVLLKIWSKKRHLGKILPNFLLNMILVYLIKTKKVNFKAMSSYQIVRTFLTHLKVSSWSAGISLSTNDAQEKCPTVEDFSKFNELVMKDVTGFYNIFADFPQCHFVRIKAEADSALQVLDNQLVNSFQSLFVSQLLKSLQYDHVAHLTFTTQMQAVFLSRIANKRDQINYGGNVRLLLTDYIKKLLEKGLGNRVKSLTFDSQENTKWKANEVLDLNTDDITITVGIILNPDEAFEVVIKGPQANDPEAATFREFWGEKSQLRRFKDGSITEACVFGNVADPFTKKRLVTKEIIKHLIEHHFSVLAEADKKGINKCLSYFGDQLNCEIDVSKNAKREKFSHGFDSELMSMDVIAEFNELDHDLRFMENLPLEITTIHGISPVFYYSDPVANFPNGYYTEESHRPLIYGDNLYEAALQLTISGKWPDNLEAIKRLKAAFFLEIAANLKAKRKHFVKVNADSFDILKNGYVFRFRLAHTKELQLMKQTVVNGLVCLRENEASLEFEKKMFIKPSLASALHGLHQQSNAFGPTVCLAKRWINSLLFDSYIWPDECTELLTASLFLKDNLTTSQSPPTQPQLGFMRFLHLLADTNWETELIILNFNEMLSNDEVQDIESKFTVNRSQFPPLTIITSFDNQKWSGIWSRDAPIVQALVRACLLAKQLLQSLDEKINNNEQFDETSIFQSNYAGYNAVIKLNAVDCKLYKALVSSTSKRLPVGFDPVAEYVKELREAYGECAAFFYNPLHAENIGVLWKPNIKLNRDFRIGDVNGQVLDDGKLVFDTQAICRDFEIIGKGLVDKVIA